MLVPSMTEKVPTPLRINSIPTPNETRGRMSRRLQMQLISRIICWFPKTSGPGVDKSKWRAIFAHLSVTKEGDQSSAVPNTRPESGLATRSVAVRVKRLILFRHRVIEFEDVA